MSLDRALVLDDVPYVIAKADHLDQRTGSRGWARRINGTWYVEANPENPWDVAQWKRHGPPCYDLPRAKSVGSSAFGKL